MGLEDIVNFLVKPMEKLAQIVYGIVPESGLKNVLGTIGKDYLSAKEVILKYSLRPVDTATKYVFTPFTKIYEAYPLSTIIAGAFLLLYYFP